MKLLNIRHVFGLSLAALLAACGAGDHAGTPTRAAALIQTSAGTSAPAGMAAPAAATASAGSTARVATAGIPAPDCAADGCKGPRIIDANAEAFRYQAMQRAAPPRS